MNATLSRSDVLKPLAWLVGLLALAIVLMLAANAPEWALALVVYALIGSIILYMLAYVFCLFMDRDALRSEKYSLHKMAMEHGLLGDNEAGLFDPKEDMKLPPNTETAVQIEHTK